MLAGFASDLRIYVEQGGFVMPPLFAFTVVLWYAIGVRFSMLRRGNRRSVREMIRKAREGVLGSPRGMVDTAVARAVAIRAARTERGSALRPYIDEPLAACDRDLNQHARLITVICAAAPLTGLLGTVTGMIETFESLGDMTLFSQSGGIAGGISQALFTTQMGLAVAIPGLIVKGLLDRRQQRIEMDLAQIKDLICAEPELQDDRS